MRSLCLLLLFAAATGPVSALDRWWVEGGERVWEENGRLYVQADNPKVPGGGVATVWSKTPVEGDFRLEVDAHVISSSLDANNINLFFCYSDPSGKPLQETRDARRLAQYDLYHKLSGYIVTFLNDAQGEGGRYPDGTTKARYRIRRDPGFRLLAEKFGDRCRQGVTYHVSVTKRGGRIVLAVDGREVLNALDPEPLERGWIGLRTYRTYLWWENFKVTSER